VADPIFNKNHKPARRPAKDIARRPGRRLRRVPDVTRGPPSDFRLIQNEPHRCRWFSAARGPGRHGLAVLGKPCG